MKTNTVEARFEFRNVADVTKVVFWLSACAISESIGHMLSRSARAKMFIITSMPACGRMRGTATKHAWGSVSGWLDQVEETNCLRSRLFVGPRKYKSIKVQSEKKRLVQLMMAIC